MTEVFHTEGQHNHVPVTSQIPLYDFGGYVSNA
jgi:hypothetical protein